MTVSITKGSCWINVGDLQRGVSAPGSTASKLADRMMGAGNPMVASKTREPGSVFCQTCKRYHRGGTMCPKFGKKLNIPEVLELIKASKKTQTIISHPKGKKGGNPYHDSSTGRFTSNPSSGGGKGEKFVKPSDSSSSESVSATAPTEPGFSTPSQTKKVSDTAYAQTQPAVSDGTQNQPGMASQSATIQGMPSQSSTIQGSPPVRTSEQVAPGPQAVAPPQQSNNLLDDGEELFSSGTPAAQEVAPPTAPPPVVPSSGSPGQSAPSPSSGFNIQSAYGRGQALGAAEGAGAANTVASMGVGGTQSLLNKPYQKPQQPQSRQDAENQLSTSSSHLSGQSANYLNKLRQWQAANAGVKNGKF